MVTHKKTLRAAGVSLSVLVGTQLAFADPIDMSKLTCEQFGTLSADTRVGLVIWLTGHAAGKSDSQFVDPDDLVADAKKLEQECDAKPDKSILEVFMASSP